MKKQKRQDARTTPAKAAPVKWRPLPWHYAVAALAALVVALEVYGPALSGPFVFDDQYLPFALPGFDQRSFFSFFDGLRPVLMVSFWMNYKLSALNAYSYHLFNVLMHVVSGCLVFCVTGRLLRRVESDEQRRLLLSSLAAGLFLLHPLQTESVAYVASRSETLSILFAYGALAVFLGQGENGITWLRSLAVLLLFGLACLTKEHTAVLPAVLILTDYYWNPGFSLAGLKRNWRLYVPLIVGSLGGGVFVLNVLRSADTAGFALKDLPWYVYLYTQWRAVWVYLRLFLFPYGQNVDHQFLLSQTPVEHGAIVFLIALAGLVVAAWIGRRKYPLASYGLLVFLLLIAPTSSVVPIRDVLVERRFYLPSLGAILIAVEVLRLWPAKKTALAGAVAAILVVCGALAWQRNHVWGSDEALWRDSVAKSPEKARPHVQLAFVLYSQGRCADAAPEFEKALQLDPKEYRALVDYGLTLDCLNRPDEALKAFQRAADVSHLSYPHALIGMIYGKQGKRDESMRAIQEALQIDPNDDMAYFYRGNLFMLSNEFAKAQADYNQAVQLNPRNEPARTALARLQQEQRHN